MNSDIRNALQVTELPCLEGIALELAFRVTKACREKIMRSAYYKYYRHCRTIRRIERAHELGLDVKGDAMGLLNPEEHPDAPFRHVRVGGNYDIWSKPKHPVKDCICCGFSFGGVDKICNPCIARIK